MDIFLSLVRLVHIFPKLPAKGGKRTVALASVYTGRVRDRERKKEGKGLDREKVRRKTRLLARAASFRNKGHRKESSGRPVMPVGRIMANSTLHPYMGFVADWLDTVRFLEDNKERLILYVILALFAAIIVLLLTLLIRLSRQKKRYKRKLGRNRFFKPSTVRRSPSPFFYDPITHYQSADNVDINILPPSRNGSNHNSDQQPIYSRPFRIKPPADTGEFPPSLRRNVCLVDSSGNTSVKERAEVDISSEKETRRKFSYSSSEATTNRPLFTSSPLPSSSSNSSPPAAVHRLGPRGGSRTFDNYYRVKRSP
ncbi:DgyrCDS7298 [Dimorphilus gyrociliatus]|uniref:DgyrCDS7298 n=1 Tax=Dimorphilus gyrociliatus TaxID=2664684 RepID=A0A7I8VSA9_9ANNE|nr:DgyrCDS7298 [Dimorphilus gyrociliatus]